MTQDLKISKISKIYFGVISAKELLNLSVCHVTETTLYDSSGDPKTNGLCDYRMGCIEPRKKCQTCLQTYILCPGHFGHIELAKPVFNIQFENEIMKIMKCICPKCSRLLVNKEHITIKNILSSTSKNNKDRFEKIYKLITEKIKPKICGTTADKYNELQDNGGCGSIIPSRYENNIKQLSNIKLIWNPVAESTDTKEIIMNAEWIEAIFKRISLEDASVLGFNEKWCIPSWMIITVLPVVPQCVRPSVRQYNNQRSEDDLTHIYTEIIKFNNIFKNKLTSKTPISNEQIEIHTRVIQYNISSLFNNDGKSVSKALSRSGRLLKALGQRIGSKEGRIRNNLMGKRVDYSARTVISPDSNLMIGELGVPMKIAINLTFPEVVNKFNINKMYECIRNGNKVYPGAKSYKSYQDGCTIMLDYRDTSKIILEYGDIVNRHLINGDIVLFNRQPSLHKMSMMAHSIRVMEGFTFRLNPNACKPYNADFDGDEMNMHVPQSIQTVTELRYLASIARHIISPSTNSPIIQPAQDTLLGLFKLTDDGTFFTQNELMNLMSSIQKFKGIYNDPIISDGKKILWSGKQLFSMILPPISIKYDHTDLKNPVIIERGILKQGQIEKKCSSKIVHIIFNDYGYVEAARYINDLQKVVSKYMIRSGFSVGISDLIIHPEIRLRNQELINKAKNDVMNLTRKVHLNALEDAITKDLITIYDGKISAIANKVADEIKKETLKTLDMSNRINYIVKSGAKGDGINIQQMSCLLAQQIIDGKKVPLGFMDRSLPHYPRYENGMESRGFITGNFVEGLSPQEFFFHAMSGREGMIDTAVKTAKSGYLQRKLVKATEDLKVSHDSSVRSSTNDIIEFCYGDDGFNSSTLEMQNSNFILINIENKNKYYNFDDTDKWNEYITVDAIKKMKKIPEWKDCFKRYNKVVDNSITIIHEKYVKYVSKITDLMFAYPVEFKRLINNTIIKFDINKSLKSDLNPIEVIIGLESLVNTCKIKNNENNTLKILAYDYLSPSKIIKEMRMTSIAFKYIIESCKAKFLTSIAEGGEMVGPLAATSIGEISTQMTLNSVSYDTELLLKINDEIKIVQIGEFIDNYMLKSSKVEDHPNDTKLGWINKEDIIYVPSVDENGNCDWQIVEAVTRHPVINEDGTNTVLRVTTEDGREVVATKAKSFLRINEENKLVGCNGSDLKVGDYLPINQKAYNMPQLQYLDMSRILSKKEYCFSTEMNKAWSYKNEFHWWSIHVDKDFTVPYKRSDIFLVGFREQKKNKNAKNTQSFKNGILYPKKQKENKAQIPEMIPYDFDFGYLIGAYLAEGCTTKTQISIANNDAKFFEPINRLMTKWNITTKYYVHNDKCKDGWTSSDLRIYSKLLTDIIDNLCGKGAANKFIHKELYNGGIEFMKGLLSGYIGGDGSVSKTGIMVSAHSVSHRLLKDIQLILCYWFGIYSKIKKAKQQLNNNRGSKNILPAWDITIKQEGSKIFAKNIPMFIDNKREQLDYYKIYDTKEINDIIPYYKYRGKTYINTNRSLLPINPFSDLRFDKISKIEQEKNKTEWVYDLTVQTTRNIGLLNGIILVDTFHFCGVGEKSTVTAGVPRMDELLANTKNPKNPSCRIFLKEEIRHDKDKCNKIRNNLELTTIKDILISSAIYLEPNNDLSNIINDDRDIISIYQVFCEINPQALQIPNNPWVIRLEFDHHKILDQHINMADIHHILAINYPEAFLMYYDNNAAKLIFRVRMNIETKTTEDDIIYLKNKIIEIENIVIKGIDDITKVWAPQESDIYIKENGVYIDKKEFCMDTDGSNLFDLIINDNVDAKRTYSVSPNDMLSVFGIEAARFTIETQLRLLLENSGNTKISHRHLALLCNKMCQHGSIMQIQRNGINRDNIGPLAKCSFEETSVQLQEAALFGVSDDIKGVSSNIMMGQIPACGIGESDILLDEEMLQTITEEIIKNDDITDIPSLDEFMKVDPICASVSNIKFSLSNINGDDMDFNILPTFKL